MPLAREPTGSVSMDNLMQSLSSMIKPDMVAALGKAISTDTSSINQGLAAVGPLAMGSMAKMASTPGEQNRC